MLFRSFCRDHLASYKRPKTLSIVDELPRNTMGKLLNQANVAVTEISAWLKSLG